MKKISLALLLAAVVGCVPRRCTAVRIEGAPTHTVFYAEVVRSSPVAYYTNDSWPWPFVARELARPHAEIRGFADRRLRKGETIIGDQAGLTKNLGEIWTVERLDMKKAK